MKTRVQLLQAHSHAGRDCLPGEVIEVDDDLAEWLIHSEVAAPIQDATDSQPEPLSQTGSPSLSKEKRK